MKTLEQNFNYKVYFTLAAIALLMLFGPSEVLAQGKGALTTFNQSELNKTIQAAWVVVQVILGLLCLVMVISIIAGMVQSGDSRAAGQKAVVLVIVLVLWAALPQIATFFGFSLTN